MRNVIVNVLSSVLISFIAAFLLLRIHNVQNEVAVGVGYIAYLVTIKKTNK